MLSTPAQVSCTYMSFETLTFSSQRSGLSYFDYDFKDALPQAARCDFAERVRNKISQTVTILIVASLA